ncbi:uncharacterized protein DUF2630 [Jatrophihabitans sp. GAS493]|nr:uncharacterized protein DUF2630 [Jatrophihabitans sp. GAS493]
MMMGMDDKTILDHIHALVAEEKDLRSSHAGHGLGGEGRQRLQHLEEQLDQAWDLLRQRRAKVEINEDPSTAQQRDVHEVESYLN